MPSIDGRLLLPLSLLCTIVALIRFPWSQTCFSAKNRVAKIVIWSTTAHPSRLMVYLESSHASIPYHRQDYIMLRAQPYHRK